MRYFAKFLRREPKISSDGGGCSPPSLPWRHPWRNLIEFVPICQYKCMEECLAVSIFYVKVLKSQLKEKMTFCCCRSPLSYKWDCIICLSCQDYFSLVIFLLLGQKENDSRTQVYVHKVSEMSAQMFVTNELNAKRRLTGLKFASKYVASSNQCMEQCLSFNIPKCKSINFSKTANKEGHLCEVNTSMNPNEFPMFVNDPEFVHYSLV